MNILYCFEGFPYRTRGGLSQVTIRESLFFQKEYDLKVHCLALEIEPECKSTDMFNGHIIIDTDDSPISKVVDYITENKIDIVIFQVIWNKKLFKIISKACKISNTKLITTIHGRTASVVTIVDSYIRQLTPKTLRERIKKAFRPLYIQYIYTKLRWHYQNVIKLSDKFVSLSERNENAMLSYLKLHKNDKLEVITNPLTYDEVITPEELENKENIVLIVATLGEGTKRISAAIKIWNIVEMSNKIGDWKLIIVGDGDDADYYKSLVKELNIKTISFEGRQEPLPYYKRASIFMMTSRTEGLPLTLLESLQNGVIPIVYNSFDSLVDIINDTKTGFIIENNNSDIYVETLLKLISNDNLRREMSLNAIESSKRFDIKTICDKWMQLFDQLIK